MQYRNKPQPLYTPEQLADTCFIAGVGHFIALKTYFKTKSIYLDGFFEIQYTFYNR